MDKAKALDKIEQLAYSYDRGKIESMREGIVQILQQYADEQRRECKSCGQLLPDECPDCEQSMFI